MLSDFFFFHWFPLAGPKPQQGSAGKRVSKAIDRKYGSLQFRGLKSLPCLLFPAPVGLGCPGSRGDGYSAKPSLSRVGTDRHPPQALLWGHPKGKGSKGEVKSVFSSSGQIWGTFISSLLALTLLNLLLKS